MVLVCLDAIWNHYIYMLPSLYEKAYFDGGHLYVENTFRQSHVADYYAANVLGAVVYEFHQGTLTVSEKGFGDISSCCKKI